MASEPHADLGALQWANNAFSLVTGALVIAAGKFGDIFGRRRMLGLGIVLFSAFSIVAALAPNVGLLITGRALMGIGAALMLPSTLGIVLFIPQGSRLESRRGGRMPVLLGLLILAAGLAVLGLLSADSTLWLLAAGLLVIGVGLGVLSTPISDTAVGGVPFDLAGAAAGVFKMSSMVGGALGVAVLSALTRGFSEGASKDALRSAGLSAADVETAKNALVGSASFKDAIASLPAGLGKSVTTAVEIGFSEGIADALLVTAGIVVVALIIVRLLWPGREAWHNRVEAVGKETLWSTTR
jgi:MFS family permease